MAANRSPEDVLLDMLRRELKQPALSLEQVMAMPVAKMLLDTLKHAPDPARVSAPGPAPAEVLSRFVSSRAVVSAAIADTFDLAELKADDREHDALLAASDIVMLEGTRRLRLQDGARAQFLDAAKGTQPYQSMLSYAENCDANEHASVGADPVRLPTAWLRCLLLGRFGDLKAAPPRELKAALAARERLRLVKHLPPEVPSLEDLRRRVGLAELLEPLRVLIGAQGGWDGTRPTDRFVGRDEELKRLRAFVDELKSAGVAEAFGRFAVRTARALTGGEGPWLMVIEGRGGLGKSTLIAKFVLDHALVGERGFPFAYLDFDRAGIDAERPHQLLLEIARQVALQFPKAQKALDELGERVRAGSLLPSIAASAQHDAHIVDPFSQFAEVLREYATDGGNRAFLLVLDTLEAVQWSPGAMRMLASLVEEFRSKGLTELRVVASGRADVPELRRGFGDKPIVLGPLEVKEARQMADKLGGAAIGNAWKSSWSTAIVGSPESDDARREPLALRVAVDLVARAASTQRDSIVKDIASLGLDADDDFVARLYEKRILGHVRSVHAQRLAWPGLVLRRITNEIVREFLAEHCNIPPDDAAKAFAALGQEVWMVTREGDALRHRPDLRARTLPFMKRKENGMRFATVAKAAARYFGERRNRSREDYVEWIYHRFLADEPPESIEPDLRPELLPLLAKAEADFPPNSPAASYLAARTSRTRLPPQRLVLLRPRDALHHLKSTSPEFFALDDAALDGAVLDLWDRFEREEGECAPELFPWLQTLRIKAGSWRACFRPMDLRDPTTSPFEASLFCAARMATLHGVQEAASVLEQYLRAVRSASAGADGMSVRALTNAMALARVVKSDFFTELDERLAEVLTKMTPQPAPSTQAAVRVAIVLGESSRRPALMTWLASRSRSSQERVRYATFSAVALRQLVGMRPSASELHRVLEDQEPDARVRFTDGRTVSAGMRVMEEVLYDLQAEAGNRRAELALGRIFATRDEDWIVPLGYAVARLLGRTLPPALSKRLAAYLPARAYRSSVDAELPADPLGGIRLADEAADMGGFLEELVAACDPKAYQDSDLRHLLRCRSEWRRIVDDAVGTRASESAPLESSLPALDRPPPPGPVINPDDPQKGRWGRKSRRAGRSVRAVLESVENDVFYYTVVVESTDDTPLAGPVVFHLHDSYLRSTVFVRRIVDKRYAQLREWDADGVFTLGVQVKDAAGKWISLELDLAELSGLPKRFLRR
jgi:hypothetical protein